MDTITPYNNLKSYDDDSLSANLSISNTLDTLGINNSKSNQSVVLQTPSSDANADASYSLNTKGWTKEKYKLIYEDTKSGMSDKQLMERYDIKNKSQLRAILYDACIELDATPIKVKTNTSASNKERPLRPLKVAADGSLRISAQQLKRAAALDLGPGAVFELKQLTDGREGFILLLRK